MKLDHNLPRRSHGSLPDIALLNIIEESRTKKEERKVKKDRLEEILGSAQKQTIDEVVVVVGVSSDSVSIQTYLYEHHNKVYKGT